MHKAEESYMIHQLLSSYNKMIIHGERRSVINFKYIINVFYYRIAENELVSDNH